MSRPRTVTVGGPWRGMEWRESQQTDQHCQVAINVDFSRGYVEARSGVVAVSGESDSGFWGRGWITDSPQGERYLLRIGYFTDDTELTFRAFDRWGTALGAAQSLKDDFGDPTKTEFKCSFVNCTLPHKSNNARFVTLIFTDFTVYVYDPMQSKTTVRQADLDKLASGGDTIRMNDINWGYHTAKVGGFIAVQHQGKVWRAGYKRHQSLTFSSTVPSLQNAMPETVLNDNRDGGYIGPHYMTYSDEFDPLGIQAHHIFAVEEHEVITGLAPFQEQLVVLTDESLYVLSGGTDADYGLYKLSGGCGCAAHGSIVQVGGSLYYAGFDGIYRWTGGGKPEKLSTPIEEMWTGRYTSTVTPDDFATELTDMGYPWLIDPGKVDRINAVHYHEADQIWWSIPVKGASSGYVYDIALVYSLESKSFAVYCTNSDLAMPIMMDGFTERRLGREQLWLVSPNGSLVKYGNHADELADATVRGVPVYWGSSRLLKGNQNHDQVYPFRFRILSKGKTPATNPPRFAVTPDAAGHDQVATEQAANLTMHPDESKDYFFGTGTFNTTKFNAIDWFTSEVPARVRTQSLRVWLKDDSDTQNRGPLLCMQDFSFDVKSGDKR